MRKGLQIYLLLFFIIGLGSCGENSVDSRSIANVNSLAKPDPGIQAQSEDTHELDNFLVAVKNLETIGFYTKKLNCQNSIDSSYCCLLEPTENWIIDAIKYNNEAWSDDEIFFKYIEPIDFEGLDIIKQYFVVAEYEVQPKMYPRAIIHEWTFASNENSMQAQKQLERLSDND